MSDAPCIFTVWQEPDKKRFRQVTRLAGEAFERFGEYRDFIGRLMIREDVFTCMLLDGQFPPHRDVAGFIQVGLVPDAEGRVYGNILAIALAMDYRYKGYGPALLEWAIEQIQTIHLKNPLEGIQLTVAPDNEPAVKLFTRYGFTFTPQEEIHFYATGVIAREMVRPVFLEENPTR